MCQTGSSSTQSTERLFAEEQKIIINDFAAAGTGTILSSSVSYSQAV
jgi:hypothetical protein